MTVKMTLDPFLVSNESYRRHMSVVDKVEAFEAFCNLFPKMQLIQSFLPTLYMHIVVKKLSFPAAFSSKG